jgi:hypothetical protein
MIIHCYYLTLFLSQFISHTYFSVGQFSEFSFRLINIRAQAKKVAQYRKHLNLSFIIELYDKAI